MQALPLILGAVGTGISVYSGFQAAKAGDAIALANMQNATLAARQQGELGQMQAQLQGIQAKASQEAAFADAENMRKRTEAESRAADENIRRSRDDFAAALAAQRNAIAARGVLDTTGSPLALLAKASEDQALYEAEQRQQDEISRRMGYVQAGNRQFEGKVQGLNVVMATLEGAAAKNRADMQTSQAKLDYMGQRAANAGQRTQAIGSLFSGLGSTASGYYNMRQNSSGGSGFFGMKRRKTSTYV